MTLFLLTQGLVLNLFQYGLGARVFPYVTLNSFQGLIYQRKFIIYNSFLKIILWFQYDNRFTKGGNYVYNTCLNIPSKMEYKMNIEKINDAPNRKLNGWIRKRRKKNNRPQ